MIRDPKPLLLEYFRLYIDHQMEKGQCEDHDIVRLSDILELIRELKEIIKIDSLVLDHLNSMEESLSQEINEILEKR